MKHEFVFSFLIFIVIILIVTVIKQMILGVLKMESYAGLKCRKKRLCQGYVGDEKNVPLQIMKTKIDFA